MFNTISSQGQRDTVFPENLATNRISPQLTNIVQETGKDDVRTPTSKARKIGRALLVIPKLLLSCVTIPLCAVLEAISGCVAGVIFGAITLFHVYDRNSWQLAILISVFFIPFTLLLGVSIAIVGLIVGPYDGAHLGWNCDVSKLKTTYNVMVIRINNFIQDFGEFDTAEEIPIPTVVYPIRKK